MKAKIILLSLLITIIFPNTFSQKSVSEQKSFDYFGQIPPKDSATVFAPGIISDTAKKAHDLAISPHGDEVFFATGVWPHSKIMYMKKMGDKWLLADTAIFSKDCWATEPAFSPDGQYLYFSTSKGKTDIKNYSLWRVKKIKEGWSQPESLFDVGGDSIFEFHPTITSDGLIYFCGWKAKNATGNIYMSQCVSNKCSDPIKIGTPINSSYNVVDPFISPDGTYMIFASDQPGGYGGLDQYISYRNSDGTWTNPKNLGSKFNTRNDDYDMDISPDGKYIFIYQKKSSIYWMPIGNLICR
jgi:hypothetical protein